MASPLPTNFQNMCISQALEGYCIAGKFDGGKFGEFSKPSVIFTTETKTIQIVASYIYTYN